MKKFAALVIFVLVGTATLAWPRKSSLLDVAVWQRQASPGPLSPGHTFLADRCAACHTPIKGVESSSCIVCHANETALLQRQATAFHSSVNECAQCHREHDPVPGLSPGMDHQKLAQIGLRQLLSEAPDSDAGLLYHQVASWVTRDTSAAPARDNPHLSSAERVLDCSTCHASKDRHGGLFGRDCAQCHATTQWTLAEYRHPAPDSLDCAQCHKAPPSHYMEHFKMVSAKVAAQPSARVRECYLCHQTTAWNDIRNVGVYKHH
ncbi:multiheme c-type cytochrome [Tahibacter amnicola]|uniref:Cytochrome C n=1 Tax=Tahibacter amnicola TaxID=2976241 RepID=A0ABY6BDU6_9GAMM|nr:cytochrome C [Tahibacter amnicola]UXI66072.1 cytochrome C [Tahibacter amnicola]